MPFTAQDLIRGKHPPVSVTTSTSLHEVLEIMVENDFSQLPVVDNSNKPQGIVTSYSILQALKTFGVGFETLKVKDVVEKVRSYYPEDDIFEILDGLHHKPAILIINNQDELIGILTAHDTTDYFRRRTEDIMLVEDIELAVRQHIEAAFADDSDTLQSVIERATNKRNLSFDKLTLGQYIRVLIHEITWSKHGIIFDIDRTAIEAMLEKIRVIRNELAHFRGEISKSQREHLRFANLWFDRHSIQLPVIPYINLPPINDEVSVTKSTDIDSKETANELPNHGESRYAALARYLQTLPPELDRVPLSFTQIKDIIGTELPVSAYKHRAWWANDSVGHSWSKLWLEAGWRVSNINISEGMATFSRVAKRGQAYIDFFSALLNDLRVQASFPVRDRALSNRTWLNVHNLGMNASGLVGAFSYTFSKNKRFRVELYIDAPNQEESKRGFDLLYSQKDAIEADFGETLQWERLDSKRASRIAIYHPGSIEDTNEQLSQLREWAVTTMICFEKTFSYYIKKAADEA